MLKPTFDERIAPFTSIDDVGVELIVGFIFSFNSLLEYETSLKLNCSTLVTVFVSFEPVIVNLFSSALWVIW